MNYSDLHVQPGHITTWHREQSSTKKRQIEYWYSCSCGWASPKFTTNIQARGYTEAIHLIPAFRGTLNLFGGE